MHSVDMPVLACNSLAAARVRRLAVIAAAIMCTAHPTSAQATRPAPAVQPGRSVLAGYIRDDFGHPIQLATILAEGTKLSTTTDDSGYFRLENVPSGRATFTAMRIGYSPVSFEVSLPADSAVNTEIHLRATVSLGKMTVTDKATPVGLTKVGFTERQNIGRGYFITPDMVHDAPLTSSPGAMLREIPGIQVTCPRRQGGGCDVRVTSGCLSLWIDGALDPQGVSDLDDNVGRSALLAMEAYPRSTQVPNRFQRNQGGVACGAIIVWTTRVNR
jgi:hypothetical protein